MSVCVCLWPRSVEAVMWRHQMIAQVSALQIADSSLSFVCTSHVLALSFQRAWNVNTPAVWSSSAVKWAMHHLCRSMHDSHLDRIISLVEVEQLMSGPHNRAQLRWVKEGEGFLWRAWLCDQAVDSYEVVQMYCWMVAHFLSHPSCGLTCNSVCLCL